MIKNIFKLIVIVIVFIIFIIFYLSFFGIKTSKFNSIIKEQVKKQNTQLNIELDEDKILLNLKNISFQIKAENPKLILNSSKDIDLDEVTSNISLILNLSKKNSIKNIKIRTKNNKIQDYIAFYKLYDKSLQFILINQFLKNGNGKIDLFLNFNEKGKIKKNYKLKGKISNLGLKILKYNIEGLNFEFEILEKKYDLKKINFKSSDIEFQSDSIKIINKDKNFFIKWNLKNIKNKISNNLLKLLIPKTNFDNVDFTNSNIDSKSKFSFQLTNKFKIKDFLLDSDLNIDDLSLNYEIINLKKYVEDYDGTINLKKNKLKIKYNLNNFKLTGSSELYLKQNNKNLFSYNILRENNKLSFDTLFDLKNIGIIKDNLGYKKSSEKPAVFDIKGTSTDDKLSFNAIKYNENKNKIKIINLNIKNQKIVNLDKIYIDYLSLNNFKNKVILTKEKNNYELSGESFDSENLISRISNSDGSNNFFNIFNKLNSEISVNIKSVNLDKLNKVHNLKGTLNINNNKINDLDLSADFNSDEKIFLKIKTDNYNKISTNFYSDRAKPFVKKYKFIKGFEKGNIILNSTEIDGLVKSRLIIDNFKVKEVPALAKLLTLASLQGIAYLLTGEGIRFTDFEMVYSKKNNLMTIDEIYAIGPAISILMEGYVENKKLISLRGTLVPATTINRTIASIPVIGNILIGKKVGEGVFGVSFKIKGPPKI